MAPRHHLSIKVIDPYILLTFFSVGETREMEVSEDDSLTLDDADKSES